MAKRDPVLGISKGERDKKVPTDIVLPSKLNAVDQGRYVAKSPFANSHSNKNVKAGLANKGQSVVETVQKAITEGRIVVGSGNLTDGDKGDITVSGSTLVWTIDNDVVTLAKLAGGTPNTIIGFDAAGDPVEITAGSNVTINAGVISASGGGGGSVEHDSLTSGAVTAEIDRIGGTATTITNPAAGIYDLDIKSGAFPSVITVFGDNTTLNGSNEMVLTIDNSANSQDRRFLVQLYDANNDALVDQQLTGTVHTQAVAGNVTTLTIPGLNGFGATGYYIELR